MATSQVGWKPHPHPEALWQPWERVVCPPPGLCVIQDARVDGHGLVSGELFFGSY